MGFSEDFKNLRITNAYNQTEFGKILGLSQQAISDLEKGRKKPSKTLMAFLKYRYSDIFSDEDGAEAEKMKPSDDKQIHSIIIEKFQQKELARNIHYELLKIEELKPEALEEISDFIKFKLATLAHDLGHMDRRRGQRRQGNENYTGEERRSGQERRKAVGS